MRMGENDKQTMMLMHLHFRFSMGILFSNHYSITTAEYWQHQQANNKMCRDAEVLYQCACSIDHGYKNERGEKCTNEKLYDILN